MLETIQSLNAAIGGTPLIPLQSVIDGCRVPVLAKCEQLNPRGSVKDRIALAIIDAAEASGHLQSGDTIVEATAGNTGIGLALIAAQRGYKVLFVMPEKMSQDKRRALRAMGAELIIAENAPPTDPRNFQRVAERLAGRPGCFLADQFRNPVNPQVHQTTTGPEIWRQAGGQIGAFVAGSGTGGTITGVGRYLKGRDPGVRIVLADPVGSRLAGLINDGLLGEDGAYLVEGIGGSEVPSNFDTTVVDEAISVSDRDSFEMALRLVREEGLLVGGSAGTAVCAALDVARRADQNSGAVVVLLPDSWDRYRCTVFDPAWMHREVPSKS